MDVLVIGPNGKTGKLLIPILLERGHRVRAMIRDESQGAAIRALGAEPVAAISRQARPSCKPWCAAMTR